MNQQTFATYVTRYVIGFALSMILSISAFFIATDFNGTRNMAMLLLLVLAAIQLVVQLICFLHLNGSDRSRTRLVTITFTLLMMMIVVIGSLWIMKNLDYRMGMSGEAMNDYMKAQNKKGF